jgi:hypothetical protein
MSVASQLSAVVVLGLLAWLFAVIVRRTADLAGQVAEPPGRQKEKKS